MTNKRKSAKKAATVNKPTETKQKGEIELKEDELKQVTGGMLACVKSN